MAVGYFTCVHLLIYFLCCCYLLALTYFRVIYVSVVLIDISALPTPSLQSGYNDIHATTNPQYRHDLQTYDQDYGFNRRYDGITNSGTDQQHRSQKSRDDLSYNLGLNHNRDLLKENPAFEGIVPSILSQDGGQTTHVRNQSSQRLTHTSQAESRDACIQEENPSVNATITSQETASYSEYVEPECPGEMFNVSMCDEDCRRRTFVRWPHSSPQPEEMARCGFYLTEYGDEVRCFWCGVGIDEWQLADDPWQEHVRVSPNCEFIRQIRQLRMDEKSCLPYNADESRVCTDNHTRSEMVTNDEVTSTTKTASPAPANRSRTRSRSYRIDEILDSRDGRRVLRQGYSRSQVANVIRSLIEGNLNLHVSYDLLMGALMSMEVRPSRRRRSFLNNKEDDV